MHAASSWCLPIRRRCRAAFANWPSYGHPGTAATVGAVWLFFINPTAALVLFMGYRFLMNQ